MGNTLCPGAEGNENNNFGWEQFDQNGQIPNGYGHGQESHPHHKKPSPKKKHNRQVPDPRLTGEGLRAAQLDELMERAQEHNLKMMKEDIKSDLNAFILDNLLLCVQLFDNFDKAASEAKEFKRDVEKQIAEKLGSVVNDGAIHGERRCVLLHGMGHQLAKNYIYKDKPRKKQENSGNYDTEDEDYRSDDSSEDEPIPEEKRTFICDGILPLEFIVTWDNLEVYTENEWDTLKDYQYSAAKGMATISRFCLEEPNEANKIPKGYARLRCVDIPLSIKQGADPVLGIPPTPDDVYYSRASDLTEKLSEVGTDSDVQSEEYALDGSAKQLANKLKKNHGQWGSSSPFPKNFSNGASAQIPPPRRIPVHPNFLNGMPKKSNLSPAKSEPNLPRVIVSRSSESIESNHGRRQPMPPIPSTSSARNLSPPAFSPIINKRLSKSVPKLTSSGAPKAGTGASVYGGTSSVGSEEILQKWRQVEVKHLGQFPNLSREHKPSEPIHQSCFMPFKVEIDSDDDDGKGSTSSEDEESSSSETYEEEMNPMRKIRIRTKKSRRRKKDEDSDDDDSKFELRYYLNSSGFSSDFCSEFNLIGKRLGINEETLEEAVVLGTTVRCSISYPKGLDLGSKNTSITKRSSRTTSFKKKDYKVLYTFTPSLHSKAWPQRGWAKIAWAQKMQAQKGPELLRWPQHGGETLIMAGCNVIPLGFRNLHNTQSEHVIQPLNWQIGFFNPEVILINTFRRVHWRCYIMAALLFRAFIAPLGPLGIGLEHIRQIMYEMCLIDFHHWTEEKPGSQLHYLIKRLYDCLAQSSLYNFFVDDHNMLRNVPSPNLRKVQAYLRPVRDNIIIHCIYAFRNLKANRNDFYPVPDFKILYKALITKEKSELIQLGIDMHGFASTNRNRPGKNGHSHKKSGRKPRGQGRIEYFKNQNQEIKSENILNHMEQVKDKSVEKKRRLRDKFEKEQRKNLKEERREKWRKKMAEALPQVRKSSIDVEKVPEESPSTINYRLPLIIKFFIRHFIQMAAKSLEFSDFAQTAMYILHTENLCDLLSDQTNETDNAAGFREEIYQLRATMGAENMREYVRSKYPHLEETNEELNEVSMLRLTSGAPSNNWVLAENRRLPPIPTPTPISSRTPSLRRIPGPSQNNINMARSLSSIPAAVPIPEENNNTENFDFDIEALGIVPVVPRAKLPAHAPAPVPRRTKFVQSPQFSSKPSFIKGAFYTRAQPGVGPTTPPILFAKNLPEGKSYVEPLPKSRKKK